MGGDPNLLDTFVWAKKHDKGGGRAKEEEMHRLQSVKQEETRNELEKVRNTANECMIFKRGPNVNGCLIWTEAERRKCVHKSAWIIRCGGPKIANYLGF